MASTGPELDSIPDGNRENQAVPSVATGPAAAYPTTAYSPVAVFGNEQFTVGASVLSPVLEDRHAVVMTLRSVAGAGEPAWELAVDLEGKLPAGVTRDYLVAVRFAD